MTKIKNALLILISLIVILALVLNFDFIAEKLKKLFNVTPEVVVLPANEFAKDDSFILVSKTEDFVPYSYQDLLNIFYTTFNNGWSDFTFYCPIEYSNCINDVEKISLNEELLSDVNNYVHPYNSYTSVKTLYDDTGKVEIIIKHLYSEKEINEIETYLNDLFQSTISDDMNDVEKIRVLHDFIINATKYDAHRANYGDSDYDSARMTGIIRDHYAICSAYADIMAVILNRLEIPNFKVSSANHVWNALYLNGKWLHLDLTWDDPITTNGRDVLEHNYFLIDNDKLDKLAKDNTDHIFNKDIYQELDY